MLIEGYDLEQARPRIGLVIADELRVQQESFRGGLAATADNFAASTSQVVQHENLESRSQSRECRECFVAWTDERVRQEDVEE